MRFENPHSLSYQEKILMKLLSMTLVNGASKIDEWGLPLKSEETSSSSQYCRIPLSDPSAAAFIAALIASGVADFSNSAARSTTETLGVGTRIAMPSSFPLR